MTKTTITKSEKLSLIGLLTMALSTNKTLREISHATRDLLGEEEEFGHVGDVIWGLDDNDPAVTARELLKKMDIKVV